MPPFLYIPAFVLLSIVLAKPAEDKVSAHESQGIDRVNSLVTALTSVEDRAALVCTSQLLCVVTHFLASALGASLLNDGILRHVFCFQSLHGRAFVPKSGRKSARL